MFGQFIVQYDVDLDSSGGNEIQVLDGYFVHHFAPENLQTLPSTQFSGPVLLTTFNALGHPLALALRIEGPLPAVRLQQEELDRGAPRRRGRGGPAVDYEAGRVHWAPLIDRVMGHVCN